jgi:hypothetical protein
MTVPALVQASADPSDSPGPAAGVARAQRPVCSPPPTERPTELQPCAGKVKFTGLSQNLQVDPAV